MDMATIAQLISTIGFPIAMCLIMTYFYHTSIEEMKKTTNTLNDTITALNNKIDALIGGRRATDDKGD